MHKKEEIAEKFLGLDRWKITLLAAHRGIFISSITIL
jgi:hypothetical protein